MERICEAQAERHVDPPSRPRVVREGQPLVPKGKSGFGSQINWV